MLRWCKRLFLRINNKNLDKGNFISVQPQDELVKKHIAYYYFHSSDDEQFHRRFFFYPNYLHALTIYKDSDVLCTNKESSVKPSAENCYSVNYSVNSHTAYKVDLNGRFNKIGIVFNPMGINHFIDRPLADVFKTLYGTFDYFGSRLNTALDDAYTTENVDEKTVRMDTFFRENYCGFNEPHIKSALQDLLNANGAVKAEELAGNLGIDRKTLLRLFKKHLLCSVEEYKKMVMFRNALNLSQQEGSTLSLTDVALYSLYYDQAHFIKHFKSITQQSPKVLLSKITQLGNQEVYWNFEE